MIYDIDGVRDYSQVESEYRYAYNEYDAVKRELDSFDNETKMCIRDRCKGERI